MKYKNLFFLTLLICQNLFGQTQIGSDVDGDNIQDYFGSSVAISDDGLTFAAGAQGSLVDGNTTGNYAKVYSYSNNAWQIVGSKINGPSGSENFGHAVALSSDGTILAVGDRKGGANNKQGIVNIYQYSSGSWSQLGSTIYGPSPISCGSSTYNNYFAFDIALSDDGTIVAIGSPTRRQGGSCDSVTDRGMVSVYQYSGGSWSQLGSDLNSDSNDQLGYSVDLSSDGTIVAAGGPYFEFTEGGQNVSPGRVKVYQFSGSSWSSYTSDIIPLDSDNTSKDVSSEFGTDISLSSNGEYIAVGDPANYAGVYKKNVYSIGILL